MRIQHFFIQEYRVLHELTLPFEQQSQENQSPRYKLDLIVGVNGTGKSTLLKLLAELFQLLDNDRIPDFTFSIQYLLHQESLNPLIINISNRDEDKQKKVESEQELAQEKRLYLKVEDQKSGSVVDEGLTEAISKEYLPKNIVALTSGSEKGWEIEYAVNATDEQAGQQLPDKNDPTFEQQLAEWYQQEQRTTTIFPPTENAGIKRTTRSETNASFLFIRQRQLPLIILCGLLADIREKEQVLTSVLREAKIKALRDFSLRLQYTETDIEPVDRPIIQGLMQQSSYAVRQDGALLLVFHLEVLDDRKEESTQRITKLFNIMSSGLELFKRLNQFMFPNEGRRAILGEVNLFFERDYTPEKQDDAKEIQASSPQQQPPLHLLEWFSDGEISFLGRFCLFSLLRESEALVLLDEPEVHFNDYWKRQLVNKIDLALRGRYSHVLMSTHSSITLSDVYNTNIWVMQRYGSFTEYAAQPGLRTLGTDPSDIIIHIFGAESATGAQSVAYLQRRIQEISALDDINTKRVDFQELLKSVGPSPWHFLIRRELHALENIQS